MGFQDGDWSCPTCGRAGKWLISSCDQPTDAAGHAIVRYEHADACHICGRHALHASRPAQAAKKWAEPCRAAARSHTYSATHELELFERTWRCQWCHQKGKELREDCLGHRPPPKKAFKFKKPTKKTLRRQKGRRLWGRPQAKVRRDRPQRHRRRGAALRAGLHIAWPSIADAAQPQGFTRIHKGRDADKGIAGPPAHPGRPPEGEAGLT